MEEKTRLQILAELAEMNRARAKQEDEFTCQEYADTEQIPRETARNRLEAWERMGFVGSRLGRRSEDNRHVRYYQVTDWDGLRSYLAESPFGQGTT